MRALVVDVDITSADEVIEINRLQRAHGPVFSHLRHPANTDLVIVLHYGTVASTYIVHVAFHAKRLSDKLTIPMLEEMMDINRSCKTFMKIEKSNTNTNLHMQNTEIIMLIIMKS